MIETVEELEKAIGYTFIKKTLAAPLVDTSKAGGRRRRVMAKAGDIILNEVLTDYIGTFPADWSPQRKRTMIDLLRSNKQLAIQARKLGVCIRTGWHDTSVSESGTRIEAIIAAIEEDRGREASRDFIISHIDREFLFSIPEIHPVKEFIDLYQALTQRTPEGVFTEERPSEYVDWKVTLKFVLGKEPHCFDASAPNLDVARFEAATKALPVLREAYKKRQAEQKGRSL